MIEFVFVLFRVRYQLGQNSTLESAIVGDGLGDNIVSTVVVKRDKNKLIISAYGGQSDKRELTIPGADNRIDLNGFMYVGGLVDPPLQYPSFHRVNFIGCMYQATFDSSYKVDFIDGAIRNSAEFSKKNIEVKYDPKIPPRAMNFDRETYVTFSIQEKNPIDQTKILQKFFGSFEFRTVLLEGTIFTASSVSMTFQRSQLSLNSGGDIVSINFPNEGQANDGRWFRVEYFADNDNLELKLNDVTKRIAPANHPQYGSQITFGLFKNKYNFIGCIRNMSVQLQKIEYYDIVNPYREDKLAEDYKMLSEGCKASDPCIPNPCFHGAECLTVVRDPGVQCECRHNYKPPLCQFCKYTACPNDTCSCETIYAAAHLEND